MCADKKSATICQISVIIVSSNEVNLRNDCCILKALFCNQSPHFRLTLQTKIRNYEISLTIAHLYIFCFRFFFATEILEATEQIL